MSIKAYRQPEFQKIPNHSFQQLKKQCSLYGLTAPPNLHNYQRQKKTHGYLQVNYLKNQLYKVSPEIHSRVPLQKQQENLRDFLIEVHNDAQKHQQIRNQLKFKYFLKDNTTNHDKASSHSAQSKRLSHPQINKKDKHQHIIQMFDPIQYLLQKQSQKKEIQSKNINKLQGLHNFAQNINSVKYISQVPEIRLPDHLPALASKSLMSFNNKKDSQLMRTQVEITNSISQIMKKSVEYQGQKKNASKRLKNYKSRNQLNKANEKKILTQRKKIMSMIEQKSSISPEKAAFQPTSLNQIPAKQKYAIDFTVYMRTKTKNQLDKYMHQKLIKKPQKELQKFQQFMLKQVKFQNQENRHKMERFFIKMREQFRRVEKYGHGSKFDWRSRSVSVDKGVKDNKAKGLTSLVKEESNNSKQNTLKSRQKKFSSASERFSKVDSIQTNKQKQKLQKIQKDQRDEVMIKLEEKSLSYKHKQNKQLVVKINKT